MRVVLLVSVVLVAAPAWARPPKLVRLDDLYVRLRARHRPRMFVVLSPPAMPEPAAGALPAPARFRIAAWLRARAERRERARAAVKAGTVGRAERARLEELERSETAAAQAALAALEAAKGVRSAAWAVIGQLRLRVAEAAFSEQSVRYEACLAANRSDCVEPVRRTSGAVAAWRHVGSDAPASLRAWALCAIGFALRDESAAAGALAAFRAARGIPEASAAVRFSAAFSEADLLTDAGDPACDAAFRAALTVAAPDKAPVVRARWVACLADTGTPGQVVAAGAEALAAGAGDSRVDLEAQVVAAIVAGGPAVVDPALRLGGSGATMAVNAAGLLADEGSYAWAHAILDAVDRVHGADTSRVRARLPANPPVERPAPWIERLVWRCAGGHPLSGRFTLTALVPRPGSATLHVAGADAGLEPLVRCLTATAQPPLESTVRGRWRVRVTVTTPAP